MRADLRLHRGRLGATGEVDLAGIRRDDESRRHGQPHTSHLREIRPFASEQVLEILVAFGEVIHELGHGKTSGGMARESARRLDQQPTYLTHDVPQVILGVPQVTLSGSLIHPRPPRWSGRWRGQGDGESRRFGLGDRGGKEGGEGTGIHCGVLGATQLAGGVHRQHRRPEVHGRGTGERGRHRTDGRAAGQVVP